jgi:hypothetical protein
MLENSSLRPSFVALSETYPLILSIGIVAQGIIFAVAQSKGLRELRIENCMALAQVMMPGRRNPTLDSADAFHC